MAFITFQPSDYFNTVTWTGTSSSPLNITGFGFQPDWVWNKYRAGAGDHQVYDAVRTATKMIIPNSSNAESTNANGVTAFITDGFTVGSDLNVNGGNSVAWGWRAGNSAGSSNSDGSITSTVSATTTAGFSIVKYTGTASAATIGHGLGVVPSVVLCKNLDTSANWLMYHSTQGATKYLVLNATDAVATSGGSAWNGTSPTSSVFSVGSGTTVNGSGNDMIAYCFAEKKGFSKFGSYTGNANADGPFIHTGFKPAFFMLKRTNSTASWVIVDNKRLNNFNPQNRLLFPNTNAAEDGSGETYFFDFLSNGVKLRTTSGSYGNGNGDSYIYMAFAEEPLVSSNNIPTPAR